MAEQQHPPHQKPSERVWSRRTIREGPLGIEPDDEALAAALLQCEGIMANIGGILTIGAERTELPDGRILTTQLVFKHQAFAPVTPAPDAEGPAAEPEPVEEPEPAVAAAG